MYTAKTKDGHDIKIYVLVEHQSTPDYYGAFRAWRYVFAAWDEIIRQAGGKQVKLPLIVPILVYNGKQSYGASLDLRSLIDGPPELISQILFKDIKLVELNRIEDEALKELTHLGVAFLTLKHAYDEIMPYEEIVVQVGKVRDHRLMKRFIRTVIRYIFSIQREADPQKLKDLVESHLSSEIGGELMTVADKLRKEGEERGEKRGEERGEKRGEKKGIVSVALNLLKSGFQEKIVSENTGLSLEEVHKLKLQHGIA